MADKLNKPRTVVGVFIFNDNDELLMIKSPKWNDSYTVPGGGIKYNESLIKALKREVKEEVGIKIEDINFLTVEDGCDISKHYKGKTDHLIFLNYKAKIKKGEKVKIDKKEATDYKWKSISEWMSYKKVGKFTKSVLEKYFTKENDFEILYKRAIADYQNLLKQSSKEKQDFAKYANEQLLLQILPVYNNLKASLIHINKEVESNGWSEGIKYVVKQFKTELESMGIEEIETEGKKFDHNIMDAIKGEGAKVKKELMPGYKLKGKVIIPAKVELE